jgi:hypothetical protein
MVPFLPRGRRLIVVYSSNSTLETFTLDRCYGGVQERAQVATSELGATLQELLGEQNCANNKWFILNGCQSG